jgi:hypothetical protein
LRRDPLFNPRRSPHSLPMPYVVMFGAMTMLTLLVTCAALV